MANRTGLGRVSSITGLCHGQPEVHERIGISIKIDGKGHLILYDKERRTLEHLTLESARRLGRENAE